MSGRSLAVCTANITDCISGQLAFVVKVTKLCGLPVDKQIKSLLRVACGSSFSIVSKVWSGCGFKGLRATAEHVHSFLTNR
jgi:hypothetical protein